MGLFEAPTVPNNELVAKGQVLAKGGLLSLLCCLALVFVFLPIQASAQYTEEFNLGADYDTKYRYGEVCFGTNSNPHSNDDIDIMGVCIGDEILNGVENPTFDSSRHDLITATDSYRPSARMYGDPTMMVKMETVAKMMNVGANELLLSYDGWQYDSNRPGSLFMLGDFTGAKDDTNLSANTLRYMGGPQHLSRGFADGIEHEGALQSIETLNLGVDDEIDKLSMPVFRPLIQYRKQYADSELDRDEFLFLFPTVKGVAFLTLSYLDKTVSAGLASVQDDIQAHVRNQLLQQINWATKEVATPEYETLFRDLDEKIEYCMRHEFASTGPSTENRVGIERSPLPPISGHENLRSSGLSTKIKNAWDDGGICGEPPDGDATPTYDWCVCYAELEARMNRSVWNLSKQDGYSVVHRVLMGRYAPREPGGGSYDSGYSIDYGSIGHYVNWRDTSVLTFVENFIDMYGDIQFTSGDVERSRAGTGQRAKDSESDRPNEVVKDGGSDMHHGVVQKRFYYPIMSLPERISFLRNGCHGTGVMVHKGCQGAIDSGDTYAELGICPSIEWLIYNWPITPETATCTQGPANGVGPGSDCFATAKSRFAEASIGKQLTARDIENWLIAAGEHAPFDQSAGWEISGHLRRIVDVYCDVAAVATVKKVHAQLKSQAASYMTANQKATLQEKAMVQQLMGRVDRELSAAEESIRSQDEPTYRLVTAGSEAERKQMADTASFTASMAKGNKISSGLGGQGAGCDGRGC